MKKILASVLSATMLLALAGCSTGSKQPSGSGSETKMMSFKLASVTPLSGDSSALGTAIANGVKLAIADKAEELKKVNIELKEFPQDDEGKEGNGTTVGSRLASDKDVIGVVGTLNSGVAKTLAPALKDAHLAMVSPANTGVSLTEQGYPHYNRIVARDDFQGPAAARATLNTVKAKSVYVLHDKTEYGQGIAEEYVKEAKKIGLEVKGNEGINKDDKDFSAVITKLMQTKPDALFYGGLYGTASLLFKQADEKGFKGAFVGADGLDSGEIVEKSGGAVDRIYYTSVADNIYNTPEGKTFYDKYLAKFNTKPDTYAVYGYDSAMVFIDALIKWAQANPGKTPTRADVEKAVRATKGLKGLTGEITFNEKGDNPGAKVYLFQIKDKKYPGVSLGEIKK
jgi:branched-chain amino acid transport system substrate-binding protein